MTVAITAAVRALGRAGCRALMAAALAVTAAAGATAFSLPAAEERPPTVEPFVLLIFGLGLLLVAARVKRNLSKRY